MAWFVQSKKLICGLNVNTGKNGGSIRETSNCKDIKEILCTIRNTISRNTILSLSIFITYLAKACTVLTYLIPGSPPKFVSNTSKIFSEQEREEVIL